MLRKPRSYAEIYNDLDSEIVNVFRMARDRGPQLREALRLTPFAREEFLQTYEPTEDPLEWARRTVARSFMGFGSNSITARNGMTGFRANSNRSGTTPAQDWKHYAELFDLLIERLRGVVIENRDAKTVMAAHDAPDTMHYVDPPYVFETRTDTRHGYKFEMTDKEHCDLADFLKSLKGFVILSGYPSALYEDLYRDWERYDRSAFADGARARIESLWISRNFQPQSAFEFREQT